MNIKKSSRNELSKIFKKHLLKKVMLRLDFADIFDAKALASEVVKTLGDKFPLREEEISKTWSTSGPTIVQVGTKTAHLLRQPKTNNLIKISTTNIILEYETYTGFDDLLNTFITIFDSYIKNFQNNKLKRLGIRKINFFDKPEEESNLYTFKDYFNDFLTYHLDEKLFGTSLIENVNFLLFKEKNFDINLQFGTTQGKINITRARRFILDLDGYTTLELDSKNIKSRIEEINEKIFDIFIWAIKEKMIGELSK